MLHTGPRARPGDDPAPTLVANFAPSKACDLTEHTILERDDATRQILDLLRDQAGPHADVVTAFAQATLRRAPDTTLAVPSDVTATWLLDAFRWFAEPHDRTMVVRLSQPDDLAGGMAGTTGTIVQVAGEDRPFLLSTVTRTIEEAGATVVRRLHPIVGTRRDDARRLLDVGPARDADHRESFLHLVLDRRLDAQDATDLRARLEKALADVEAVTDDHDAMRNAVRDAAELAAAVPTDRVSGDDPPTEVVDMLHWLLDDHLVMLGWRSYDVDWGGAHPVLSVRDGSGRGILRDATRSRFGTPTNLDTIDPEVRTSILDGPMLRVTRTSRSATVHRLRRMLDVSLNIRDGQGRVVAVHRLLGLLSATGLAVPSAKTPVLRRRLGRILEMEDVVPGSHEETTLVGLFQSLPKDELLELSVEQLRTMLVALLEAEEQRRIRALVRVDEPTRTVTVVLAVPRDDYRPAMRERVTELLATRVGTPVDADLSMGQHADVVVRFTAPAVDDLPDGGELEVAVTIAAQPWMEQVTRLLADTPDIPPAQQSRRRELATRLPDGYQSRATPARAVRDVQHLDDLVAGDQTMTAWLDHDDDGTILTLAQRDHPVVLSEIMPVLESLGLRVDAEHPHRLSEPGPVVHLHEYRLGLAPDDAMPIADHLTQLVVDGLQGRAEIDGLNELVLRGGLSSPEVAIVRAYRRYRRQVGTSFSAEYTNRALAGHPDAVRAILEVFRLRFDPSAQATPDQVEHAHAAATAACDAIERLDHDRIVRGILHLVDATLRTSVYVRDHDPERGWTLDAAGQRVPVWAFKFDPALVPDMPAPMPYREVFVASPAVEGIHLRGGPISRGGLRFSDRHDDLRTEILGLVKAQVLKNALIVPTGAKGGFVCKRLPDDPVAARADVRRQYIAFIGALLDVTDNLDADGTVVPPGGVVRLDGDDPYLVVAADKGTATFSDTANEVAESRGFWLGDAFASGGSSGYDHKELGITARGAWMVITRHFRELGIDLQTDPVRVAGVGDMSGDVFGNGMLLSRSLRLVAAFDHRDIFLDPEPDAEATHAERQRLFHTPGTTWQDHDRNVLSPGAMIVSRASKAIQPTPEVRALLGLEDRACAPDELMRAILRCQVDLLWFGGIGTYVKASTESHADVGDRINDDIRVDATDLRARVIGEGANLAVTPRARVQYARRGGRVDQDAIHNAAGVDISDHEVNIKILLGLAEADGRLERPARDALLADIALDVVAHVLQDVDRQGALLSRLAAVSAERLEDLRTLLAALESADIVNRTVDDLPDDDELAERAAAGAGLTRPELATLMAGAKRVVFDALLDSSLPDDPTIAASAASYFPPRLLDDFGDLVPRHRLHREVVATVATNDLVDRLGPVWPFHLAAETGAPLQDALAATLAAWHVVGGATWFEELDTVDEVLPPDRVQELATSLARMVMAVSRRYLDDPLVPDVAAITARDQATFDAMLAVLPQTGSDTRQRQRRIVSMELTDNLVHPHLATLLSGIPELGLVVDVAATSRSLGAAPDVVAHRMLAIAAELGLDRLATLVERVNVSPEWERRERKGLAADVQRLHGIALRRALPDDPGPALQVAPDLGLDPRRRQQLTGLLSRIDGMPDPPLPAVSVVVRAFADLLAR